MRLNIPLSEKIIRELRVGEIVHITGRVFTMRDLAHDRLLYYLRNRKRLPFSLRDGVIYHCGPIMRREENGWIVASAGPTTSARMNGAEPEVIRRTGVRAIVGKGGMNGDVGMVMKERGCVYLAFTGGAAVVAARGIGKVVDVHWSDLGMAEAVWELEFRDFGPLIVAMDASGNSIYREVEKKVWKNREMIMRIWKEE